jgi:hypothetical protein
MRSTILGIDPGRTGALVLLDFDTGQLVHAARMPIHKGEVSREGIVDLFDSFVDNTSVAFCAIERVHSRPSNGVVAAFAFGMYSEMMRMSCACYDVDFIEVTPQQWQRDYNVPPKEIGEDPAVRTSRVKNHLVVEALKRWKLPIVFKADTGMADAALIAEWARVHPACWPARMREHKFE